MRVVLYEPDHTGHHFAYLGRMLPGLMDSRVQIILACTPEGAASDEFRMHLAPFSDRISVEPVCDPSLLLGSNPGRGKQFKFALLGLQRVREFTRLTQQLKADHAVIMYGDGMWQWIQARSMLGIPLATVPVETGLFGGGFTYEDARGAGIAIRRALFSRLMKSRCFARLCIYDELFHRFATTHRGTNGPTVTLMPDPVEIRPPMDMAAARTSLGIDPSRRWLVCAGMIDQRKGCDLALKALKHVQGSPQAANTGLLLAGPHSEPLRSMLAGKPYEIMVEQGDIVSLDHFLSTEEMFASAAAAEVILAIYPNHSGRSSIILWAGSAGRPCIGSARGAIGEMIRTQQLGEVVKADDILAVAASITTMLSKPWTTEDEQRVRAHAQQYSVLRYQELGCELVRSRLGDPV